MKYSNLIGKEFNCRGFSYFYTSWSEKEALSKGRGAGNFVVAKHQIHDYGALEGIECIYEEWGGYYFVYPVSELERTGQIEQQNEIYEIY